MGESEVRAAMRHAERQGGQLGQALLRQADRVALLAMRLVEEGVFPDADAAIEWADSEMGKDMGL